MISPRQKTENITFAWKELSQKNAGIVGSLMVTLFLMLLGMTAYEFTKQLVLPRLTIWESHLITILFSSTVATVAAYFILTRRQSLQDQALREIVERKRAVDQLRDSERMFQTAFDYAPNGIALFTPNGQFVQVNFAFCEILGYSREKNYCHETSRPLRTDTILGPFWKTSDVCLQAKSILASRKIVTFTSSVTRSWC